MRKAIPAQNDALRAPQSLIFFAAQWLILVLNPSINPTFHHRREAALPRENIALEKVWIEEQRMIEKAKPTAMNPADHGALRDAVLRLEKIGPIMRAANAVGRNLNSVKKLAPEQAAAMIDAAAIKTMKFALRAALATLHGKPPNLRAHKILAAASGAAGGALGLAALPLELPFTTTVILRSIAEIAQNQGEDLHNPENALACLEVFALDGRDTSSNVVDSGYFAIRGLLARTISEAARYIAGRAMIDESAPALVRLMAQIGARFGVVVSQKFVAQATPAFGAFGGAAVNLAFTAHFQSLAIGHFTVRRLERKYGEALVGSEYLRIAAARNPDAVIPPAA